jgi:hypothetical protein
MQARGAGTLKPGFICRIIAAISFTALAFGQLRIMPLKEVKAGMRGIGKTVFADSKVEDFPVEILGVMENLGPKQSIILARLGGPQIERTGVMQGMSGSPVYINGRLVGAVALAFPFAKEPIAGVRPIEEMLDVTRDPAPTGERTQVAFGRDAQSKLMEISTPLSLAGFTRSAFDHFAPELRAMGLEPMQGALGGGGAATTSQGRMGDPKILEPGSMISVLLMTGDMAVSADGTVTAIDGKEMYAFGHRFMAGGELPIPFARADVLALLPNVNASFKISTSRELMGVINQDRNAAIAGVLGARAPMVPISITVHGAGLKTPRTYKMEFISDRTLSPLLAQMAIYSALDGTERSLGPGSVIVHGEMALEGGLPPIQLDNVYSADSNAIAQAAVYSTIPLSYLAQSGLEGMRPKSITLDVRTSDRRNQLQVEQVWPSNREVHPGETIELNISLTAENGSEILRKVKYPVPVGAPLGTLFVTVSDGMTANLVEFSQAAGVRSRTPAQVIKLVNSLRQYNRVSVRLSRAEPSYQVQGSELPDPPPSVALLLAKAQPTVAALTTVRGAKVAEFELDLGMAVTSGTKTTQVEIKEQ